LHILHEDPQIAVVVKPVGASSEETQSADVPCVPVLLREHLGNPRAYVGVVHRLDTGVGGAMVYAKTPAAAASLSAQVQDGRFEKEYRCLCAGVPEPAQGQMQDYLFKDSKKGKVFPVKGERKGAKHALLDYEVIASAPLPAAPDTTVSLCRVRLHTGRTHQIRVQFASRKHPLLGDGKYGSRIKGNIALQCAKISFLHPKSGEHMEFTVPIPEDWMLKA